jgi:hypothetical protein
MTERLQKIGQTVNEYKDALTSHFRDMDVDVKDWHFTVGKCKKKVTTKKLFEAIAVVCVHWYYKALTWLILKQLKK